jgi:hypothetical protein
MTREELVRLAVLMTIADDYEQPVHVYQCVAGDLGPCGLWVAPEETQTALIEITESGLAKAYRLSPPAEELQGVPPFDGSHDYYFLITEDGLRSLAIGRPATIGLSTMCTTSFPGGRD